MVWLEVEENYTYWSNRNGTYAIPTKDIIPCRHHEESFDEDCKNGCPGKIKDDQDELGSCHIVSVFNHNWVKTLQKRSSLLLISQKSLPREVALKKLHALHVTHSTSPDTSVLITDISQECEEE